MMPVDTEHSLLADCLECSGLRIRSAGHGCWVLEPDHGMPVQATLRARDGWLLFDAPLPGDFAQGCSVDRAWELLEWHTEIPGNAKFAIEPATMAVHLCAEFPREEERSPGEWIATACAALRSAWQRFYGGPDVPEVQQTTSHGLFGDVAALCRAAGWPIVERADGTVAIELDASGGFYEALVRPIESRGVRLRVERILSGAPAATARRALGLFLLGACWSVRMARATATVGQETVLGWEVVLDAAATSAELHHALSVLSLACRLFERESEALEDERIAQTYLAVRGWSP